MFIAFISPMLFFSFLFSFDFFSSIWFFVFLLFCSGLCAYKVLCLAKNLARNEWIMHEIRVGGLIQLGKNPSESVFLLSLERPRMQGLFDRLIYARLWWNNNAIKEKISKKCASKNGFGSHVCRHVNRMGTHCGFHTPNVNNYETKKFNDTTSKQWPTTHTEQSAKYQKNVCSIGRLWNCTAIFVAKWARAAVSRLSTVNSHSHCLQFTQYRLYTFFVYLKLV